MRSPDGKFECVNDGGGGSQEVTNVMERKKLEVLCIQETTWKGDTARILAGECKMLHARGDGKSYGVGIIVSEEISKDVVRVERWQGRIIVSWMMSKKQLVCITSMYEPQTGRAETEKRASREELERMVGLVEAHVIMCLAGYFNGQEKKNRLGGVRMRNKESRTGRIGYEKRAGRVRNILQGAGKPQNVA